MATGIEAYIDDTMTANKGRRMHDRQAESVQQDHDLLIEIRTTLDMLVKQVHDSNQSTGERLEILNSLKADGKDLELLRAIVDRKADQEDFNAAIKDYEARMRDLESKAWKLAGGALAISALTGLASLFQITIGR